MDYKFAIRCWQDQAGSENAKANVFVNGTQVATEVEITATDVTSPNLITWESTDLSDPADDTTFDIKVVLANEYYVDESTDRNIHIDGIGYICKDTDGNYKKRTAEDTVSTITDFTNFENYCTLKLPTAVIGDQIPGDFWDREGNTESFYTITVWGGDTGVTITLPVIQFTYM